MNVLLIEPDIILARTYAKWLTASGFTVQVARSAQSAIHAADKTRPDIVVLELQLARHNGVGFLYEFRSYDEWQNIPVVLHTMVPGESIELGASVLQKLGVGGYLYKPTTTLLVLTRTIRELLGVGLDETAAADDRHSIIPQGLSRSGSTA